MATVGALISIGAYSIYIINEINTIIHKIDSIYHREVQRKKENPNEPIACEEAMILLESASYLVYKYIHVYRYDIIKKVIHLKDNKKFASDLIGLNRLATNHEIKFCIANEERRIKSSEISTFV